MYSPPFLCTFFKDCKRNGHNLPQQRTEVYMEIIKVQLRQT